MLMGSASSSSVTAPCAVLSDTVFIVDEDVAARKSLDSLIRRSGWRPDTFASAEDFLARPRVYAPSCLVMDVCLPGLNGLDLQRLVADRSDMPVIFVTGHGDIRTIVRAMKAGALEFMAKPFKDEELLRAIRNALVHSREAQALEADLRMLRERYESLTGREREVMLLVVVGYLNKQVARELAISEITVKAHRGKVMRKMQAGSLPELVKMALELRLASPPTGQPSPPLDQLRWNARRFLGHPTLAIGAAG